MTNSERLALVLRAEVESCQARGMLHTGAVLHVFSTLTQPHGRYEEEDRARIVRLIFGDEVRGRVFDKWELLNTEGEVLIQFLKPQGEAMPSWRPIELRQRVRWHLNGEPYGEWFEGGVS
jgi:hypothetical protein